MTCIKLLTTSYKSPSGQVYTYIILYKIVFLYKTPAVSHVCFDVFKYILPGPEKVNYKFTLSNNPPCMCGRQRLHVHVSNALACWVICKILKHLLYYIVLLYHCMYYITVGLHVWKTAAVHNWTTHVKSFSPCAIDSLIVDNQPQAGYSTSNLSTTVRNTELTTWKVYSTQSVLEKKTQEGMVKFYEKIMTQLWLLFYYDSKGNRSVRDAS